MLLKTDKVLCYGLYVEPETVEQHVNAVRYLVKYAWDRKYTVDKAMQLVYLVNGHHVKWKELVELYKEFKND